MTHALDEVRERTEKTLRLFRGAMPRTPVMGSDQRRTVDVTLNPDGTPDSVRVHATAADAGELEASVMEAYAAATQAWTLQWMDVVGGDETRQNEAVAASAPPVVHPRSHIRQRERGRADAVDRTAGFAEVSTEALAVARQRAAERAVIRDASGRGHLTTDWQGNPLGISLDPGWVRNATRSSLETMITSLLRSAGERTRSTHPMELLRGTRLWELMKDLGAVEDREIHEGSGAS